MKVAVAGATSTLGRPAVAELARRGHQVVGLTRSPASAKAMSDAGTASAVVDVGDAASLRAVLDRERPDAVLSLLIKLPRNGPTRWGHFRETTGLWDRGVPSLLAAARDAGARRIVAESVVFAYGYGSYPQVLVEASRPDEDLSAPQRRVLSSLRRMEQAVAGAGGTVLRLGAFRGPAVPTEQLLVRLMRRRLPVLPGGGKALLPFVDITDAARAVADAVEARSPGPLYNVADDDSAEFHDYALAVARAAGTPLPRTVPGPVARLATPYSDLILGRVRMRVANALAARDLGWRPAAPPLPAPGGDAGEQPAGR